MNFSEPKGAQHAENRAENRPSDCELAKQNDDLGERHLPSLGELNGDFQEDEAGAVVEERLALNEAPKSGGRADLLQQGQHGDGVGAGEDGGEQKRCVPGVVRVVVVEDDLGVIRGNLL